jgi:hypothetical protein
MGSSRVLCVRVREMDVKQGLSKPFPLRNPSIFGLCKPNPGGGGGIRTCGQGLMSSAD